MWCRFDVVGVDLPPVLSQEDVPIDGLAFSEGPRGRKVIHAQLPGSLEQGTLDGRDAILDTQTEALPCRMNQSIDQIGLRGRKKLCYFSMRLNDRQNVISISSGIYQGQDESRKPPLNLWIRPDNFAQPFGSGKDDDDGAITLHKRFDRTKYLVPVCAKKIMCLVYPEDSRIEYHKTILEELPYGPDLATWADRRIAGEPEYLRAHAFHGSRARHGRGNIRSRILRETHKRGVL